MTKQLFTTALVLAFAGSQGFCTTNLVVSLGGVKVGSDHGIGLTQDHTVKAWGTNQFGTLGIGTTGGSCLTNVDVKYATGALLSNVTSIATGSSYSMALLSDGTVFAWGRSAFGTMGDGIVNHTNHPNPTRVGISNVSVIASGGFHGLAISNGYVYAWGQNTYGQVAGTATAYNDVQSVSVLSNAVAIAGGDWHSLALLSNGTVYGWGNNGDGQLGNGLSGSANNTNVPQQTLLSGVSSIAAGARTSFAISNGVAYSWGFDTYHQLGRSYSTGGNITPAPVADVTYDVTNVTSVTTRNYGSVVTNLVRVTYATLAITNAAITNGNTVSTCVEYSNYVSAVVQEVYTNYCDDVTVVTNVETRSFQSNVIQIAGGSRHTIALTSDGRVWAWGANTFGALGINKASGFTTNAPTAVLTMDGSGPLTNVVSIATSPGDSAYSSLAVLADGTVVGWGQNSSGQIGDGTATDRYLPVVTP